MAANITTTLPTSAQLAAVDFDDRTPLGLFLTHPENAAKFGDALRIRASMIIIDGLLSGIPTAVQQAVSALVGSAPASLDTIRELADALGNDPNFATTVMAAIGGKASTADLNGAVAALQAAIGNRALASDVYSKSAMDTALALLLPKAGGRLTDSLSSAVSVSERLTGGTKTVPYAGGNVREFTIAGAVTFNPTGLAAGDVLQLNLNFESGSVAFSGTTYWQLGGAVKSTNFSDLKITLVANNTYQAFLEVAGGRRMGIFS